MYQKFRHNELEKIPESDFLSYRDNAYQQAVIKGVTKHFEHGSP